MTEQLTRVQWRGTGYNVLIRGRVPRHPRESDPPGVTLAGAVNHMTHELFFAAILYHSFSFTF